MAMDPFDYKAAGVNVASGDEASKILFEAAKRTWANRAGRLGEVQTLATHFRTFRYFEIPTGQNDICFGMNFDGIGSKIELAERLHSYGGLASDLFAMTCDDAAVASGEPLLVGSILDMGKVDLEIVRALAEGMAEAAATAGVAVINGELAELPGRVQGFGPAPFNWGGACLWAARRDHLAQSAPPQPGDSIVGIAERGFRSNGYSLLRAIFRRAYGDAWGTGTTGADLDLIRFAAQPSVIYTPFVLSLTGGLTRARVGGLKGLVHVTGGGLVGRVLFYCHSNSLGATITAALAPPPEMCDIREIGGVEIAEAYNTWNMGVGLLVVCSEQAVSGILQMAEQFGLRAAKIGAVTSDRILDVTFYDGTSTSYSVQRQ